MVRRRIPASTCSTLFLAALALLALAWLAAGAASAAFPNENGRIAFTMSQGSGRDSSSDIWVMNPDGSEKTRLTCDGRSAGPSWSPDGQRIAFDRGGSAWLMDADGRNPTRVGPVAATGLWSPTSDRLAFVRVDERDPEVGRLDVVNADGSGRVSRLLYGEEGLTAQAWSPDGQRLVTDKRIFDPDTGEFGEFDVPPGSDPAWSSGDVIAFVRYFAGPGPDIWTINPDGSGEAQLTDDPDWDRDPLWSPDGRRISFVKIDTSQVTWRTDLWVMDADGGNQMRLARGVGRGGVWSRVGGGVWSPDGERIAFVRVVRGGGLTRELWVTSADGSGQTLLAEGAGGPIWSPDGRRIAFWRGGGALWMMDADGSDQTLLAEGVALLAEGVGDGSWQALPPGTSLGPPPSQLCFEAVRRNKRRGIARLVVEVPRPGRVILHRRPGVKRFARAHRDESGGRVALKVRPRGKARQRLNRTNRVRVRAQVTYRPWVGEAVTKGRRVWVVKR